MSPRTRSRPWHAVTAKNELKSLGAGSPHARPETGNIGQIQGIHSYISHLFDIGINPDEIRRMAGHENIEMTMRYCRGRNSPEELARILEQDAHLKRCNNV